MSRGRASLSALTMTALLVFATAYLFFRPDHKGEVTVKAEFADVFPLLEGNKVRVFGGIAGVVTKLEATPRSTVMVTMELNSGSLAPRSDATASVRAQDLLGENYLALSPGRAPGPIKGPIPPSQTSVAPRLSDLLNTFDAKTRIGLQAVLTELGVALDRRGTDVNRALTELRPALVATDQLVTEAASQNASLRTLIPHLEGATRQLADRREDLGQLVDNAADLLKATAAVRPAISAGLERLPDTLSEVRTTGAALEQFARRATPLASELQAVAPDVQTAAELLPGFLDQARTSVDVLAPTLDRAGTLLDRSQPALQKTGSALSSLRAAGPDLSDLVTRYMAGQDSVGPLTYTDKPTQSVGAPPEPAAYPVENVSALRRLVFSLLGTEESFLNTYFAARDRYRSRPDAGPCCFSDHLRVLRPAEAAGMSERRCPRVDPVLHARRRGQDPRAAKLRPRAGRQVAARAARPIEPTVRPQREPQGVAAEHCPVAGRPGESGDGEHRPRSPDAAGRAQAQGPGRRRHERGQRTAGQAPTRRCAQAQCGADARSGPAVAAGPPRLPPAPMRTNRRPQLRGALSRGAQVLERQTTLLGIVSLLLIAAVTYVGFKAINGVPFQKRYELHAILPPETPPLKKGDIVRVAGQRAGAVSDAIPTRDGLKVTMELTPSYAPVGRNARATVRQKAAGGVFYVDVTRGDFREDPARENTTIPPERTSAGADLLTVISKFDTRFRKAMAQTNQVTGETLLGRGQDLNLALRQLPETLDQGASIFGSVTARPGAFSRMLGELGRTGSALTPAGGNELASLVTAGARGTRPFSAGAEDLQRMLTGLRPFEDRALLTLPVANQLLNDAGPMAQELRPTVDALRRALPATTTLLRAGVTLREQSTRLAEVAKPVLEEGATAVPQLFGPAALLRPIARDARTIAAEIAPYDREAFVFGDSLTRGAAMIAPATDITTTPELRMQRVNFIFTCLLARNPYPEPGQSHVDRAPVLNCPKLPVGAQR